MALNANCVANVMTTGSDSNAGWFDTSSGDVAGGANDRAYNNAPVIIDGGSINASVHSTTTQANITGFTVTSALRGNVLRISGGSATAGYYRITGTDAGNNRVTVDQSMGSSGATITGRIGGAFASPSVAASSTAATNGTRIHWQSGAYTASSTTTTASNACVQVVGQTSLTGYGAAYGDGLGRPVLTAQGISNATLIRFENTFGQCLRNVEVDGANLTGISGISGGSNSWVGEFLVARRCVATGISSGSNGRYVSNSCALSCGLGFSASLVSDCVASSCTTGFQNVLLAVLSIATGCATGFQLGGSFSAFARNCIAYGCTSEGFSMGTNTSFGSTAVRCVASSSGVGFSGGAGVLAHAVFVRECVAQGNSTNFGANIAQTASTILSASPWTDPANGDFTLNNTAGGGAVLRAMNFQMPGISTTRYPFGGWYAPSEGSSRPPFSSLIQVQR